MKHVWKIESYSVKDGILVLSLEDWGSRSAVKSLVDACSEKHEGHVMADLMKPARPRTTGAGSQNSKIWGLITEIAGVTGNDIADVEEYAKERATRRGYPYTINRLTGRMKCASMTTIDTKEAAILIEELEQILAEYGQCG